MKNKNLYQFSGSDLVRRDLKSPTINSFFVLILLTVALTYRNLLNKDNNLNITQAKNRNQICYFKNLVF